MNVSLRLAHGEGDIAAAYALHLGGLNIVMVIRIYARKVGN